MSGTRRNPGDLGPYVEGYRARLLGLGYAPATVTHHLKVLGQLGRWLAGEGLEVARLDGQAITRFVTARHAEGFRVVTPRSFVHLLRHLRDEGVIGAEDPRQPTSRLDGLIASYRQWLVAERALAPATVLRYEALAKTFLEGRSLPADELGLGGLNGAEVARFLVGERARLSLGSAKARVAELRSLLRFLHLKGLIALPLAQSVPPVAGWRDTSVPKAIPAADVEGLLGSCDRSTLAGARDFAVLLLLARLGLRSAEVAWLELADLDWRAGEVVVRGKACSHDRLPLPHDVGEALAAYLSLRGRTGTSRVFLTLRPPRRPVRPGLVSDVVERACRRAGLAEVGPHRLRHSLATEMLRQGASLVDISQVLRHRDLATTGLYAKVDLGRLRQVARPWPGAGR